MKPSATLFFLIVSMSAFAQDNVPVRRDTIVFTVDDMNWLIPMVPNNDTLKSTKTNVVTLLFDAIVSGQILAIDPQTNDRIEPGNIYNWKQPVDTLAEYNEGVDSVSYKIVQKTLDLASIKRMRVEQQWVYKNKSGLESKVTWIELQEEIHRHGFLLGYRTFCRLVFR